MYFSRNIWCSFVLIVNYSICSGRGGGGGGGGRRGGGRGGKK